MPLRPATLDWTMTAVGMYFVGGLFLDGWAHTHGRVDETFFTPWHAVLYSGYLASAIVLAGAIVRARLQGRAWRDSVPDGYLASLVGVALWLVGGPFDFAWHEVFGFEVDVEALMSPAHTILAVGAGLIVSGPLRATLRRPPGRWRDDATAVLALTALVSVLTFFTQIAHAVPNVWGGPSTSHDATELGLTGLCLTTAILIAPLLLLIRVRRMPAGGITLVVGLNAILMGFLYDRGPYPLGPVVAIAAGAGLVDLVRGALRPDASRPAAFRAFAFAAPVIVHAAYFAAVALTTGLAWTTHLWVGAIVFTGIIGWLASYLVLWPRVATPP